MFSSIKKIFSKQSQQEKKDGLNTPTMIGQTIGGPTKTKPMKSQPLSEKSNTEQKITVSTPNNEDVFTNPKIEELATIFSEGDKDKFLILDIIKNYFKEKQGNVEKRIWYMLMDLHQTFENKEEFEKTSLAFAQYFETSPPSWFESNIDNKKNNELGMEENVFIFPKIFQNNYTEEFKIFFNSARKNQFCRINISQCKFESNDADVLVKFIDLLQKLRKDNITTVLMGDNNIIKFIQNFIKDSDSIKNLHSSYLQNPKIVWLANLEFLQWKNKFDEFETFSIKYAEKFEISPPSWDNIKNIRIENIEENISTDFFRVQEKELNSNNIELVLKYIDENISTKEHIIIDFSLVERIDFSTAGILSYHTQEIKSQLTSDKTISIKNPNEMILVLFQILGMNEILNIEPRKRN